MAAHITTHTTPDNMGIAYICRLRSPDLTPAQLCKAVRIEDRRDTFGRKRTERVKRVPFSPAVQDSLTCVESSPPVDIPPLFREAMARLEAAGMKDLALCIMRGMKPRQAALSCGISERTARHRLAIIREELGRSRAE